MGSTTRSASTEAVYTARMRVIVCGLLLLGCGTAPVTGGDGGGGTAGGSSGGGAGGSSGGSAGGSAGGADTDAGIGWQPRPSLPASRQETGVAALGGEVYVVGGFIPGGTVVGTVEAYDPATRSWRDAGTLPQAMHHANVAAVGGKLYVVGGLTGLSFTASRSVYEYDPATRQWTAKAPMPAGTERGGAAVGVIGSRIYLAGGFRGGSVADFSSYEPATDTHAALAPLPAARDHLVGGAVGTSFYAIGGRRNGVTAIDGRVDRYDTSVGGWTAAAPMLTPRAGSAAGTWGTRIIVAGGEGNRAGSSTVFPQTEIFDTVANSWADAGTMRTPRHGTGGAAVDGVFYMPGGATAEGFGATATVEAIAFP